MQGSGRGASQTEAAKRLQTQGGCTLGTLKGQRKKVESPG